LNKILYEYLITYLKFDDMSVKRRTYIAYCHR